MRIPRSRGAVSGLLLMILGAWGALVPFIGPYFDLVIGSDEAWDWSQGRFWLSVLPGIVAFVGGAILLRSAHRGGAGLGAWLGILAGAWFVVGPTVSRLWTADGASAAGTPAGGTERQVLEVLAMYEGLGVLIAVIGAFALGRLAVRAVKDVELVERERELAAQRDADLLERERAAAPAHDADRDHVAAADRRDADVADRDRDRVASDRHDHDAADRDRVVATDRRDLDRDAPTREERFQREGEPVAVAPAQPASASAAERDRPAPSAAPDEAPTRAHAAEDLRAADATPTTATRPGTASASPLDRPPARDASVGTGTGSTATRREGGLLSRWRDRER